MTREIFITMGERVLLFLAGSGRVQCVMDERPAECVIRAYLWDKPIPAQDFPVARIN